MKKLIIPFLFLLYSVSMLGQTGLIRGTLYDEETGETIPYGTVYLENDKGTGTSTDLDGAFELQLPVGTHDITFSYIGYASTTVQDIAVTEGEMQIINPKSHPDFQTLTEIVETFTQKSNTQSALCTIRRMSPNVIDGESRELFFNAGVGDAGAAPRR